MWRFLNTSINLKHHSNFKYYSLNLQWIEYILSIETKNLQKKIVNNFSSENFFFGKKKKFKRGFLYLKNQHKKNFKQRGKIFFCRKINKGLLIFIG